MTTELDMQREYLDIEVKWETVRSFVKTGKNIEYKVEMINTFDYDVDDEVLYNEMEKCKGDTLDEYDKRHISLLKSMGKLNLVTTKFKDPNITDFYKLDKKYSDLKEFLNRFPAIISNPMFGFGTRICLRNSNSFLIKELERLGKEYLSPNGVYDCFLDSYENPTLLLVYNGPIESTEYQKYTATVIKL